MPGIGFSPDKMLQARIFSHADRTAGHALRGAGVNPPRCPVHHHKDGPMRFFRNDTGNPDANYEPNSFGGPVQDPRCREPPLRTRAMPTATTTARAPTTPASPAPYSTCSARASGSGCSRSYAEAMAGVLEHLVERQLGHLAKVHPDYAAGMRQALNAKGAKIAVE